MAKLDQYRYELKKGRKVVYRGITTDPERREREHRNSGRSFDRLDVVGRRVTEETARKWEERSLESYGRNHKGMTPKYNRQS